MTKNEREAVRLMQKYDLVTLAPLAVNCGLLRVLQEREQEKLDLAHVPDQMKFHWHSI